MFAVAAAAADAVRSRLAAAPAASSESLKYVNENTFPNGLKLGIDEMFGQMQQQASFFGAQPSVFSTTLDKLATMMGASDKQTQASSQQLPLFVALTIIACTMWFYQVVWAGPNGLKPPKGSRLHVIHSWIPALGQTHFYGPTRSQWVKTHMGDMGAPQEERSLRMNLSKYVVSIVHGAQAARDFFSSRHLNFYAGFGTLFSGIEIPNNPREDDEETDEEASRKIDITKPPPTAGPQHTLWQIKHLRNCLSNRRLTEHDVMAKVAGDCWRGLAKIWAKDAIANADRPAIGSKGLINMHEQLYEIMFRISVRVVGATEMADEDDLKPIMNAYWTMENNQTFTNTLMSNMPTPSNRKRKAAALELQRMIKEPIDNRIASGHRHEDYVQVLLDCGVSSFYTTIWVTMVLFASIINTSSIFAWSLALASANPDVWSKLRDEVNETIDRLADENGLPKDAPVVDKVASMSIEQLEGNFNYTYWCIRETIRMLVVDFSYRRIDSPTDTVTIGGQQVRQGEFLAFCLGTIHYDPRVYSSPERYDPDRWVRGEASRPFEFMGWGGGAHPCIGMKLAKNELKLAVAMFVACNDIRPVDLNGNAYAPHEVPLPDLFRGGYRLPTKPLRLEYTVRRS